MPPIALTLTLFPRLPRPACCIFMLYFQSLDTTFSHQTHVIYKIRKE
jgi:hypothetical protein